MPGAFPVKRLMKIEYWTRRLSWLALAAGCILAALPAATAWAEEAATGGNAEAGRRFAVVSRLRGEVVASSGSGSHRLAEGEAVYVGERLRATSTGEALLKTDDAGYVGVRPGAEFVAERFAAEGRTTDHFVVRIFVGSLRIITGWIGRLNRDEHLVRTPSATIGIRGTDHEPYVLGPEQAAATPYQPGTYDKVNRGRTTLGEGDRAVEIEAGRVGYARPKSRALLTILMPVLLDKVPDFYVPGAFDAELDRLSQGNDEASKKALEKPQASGGCDAAGIARAWLQRFDGAIEARKADDIIALFAPEVVVHASVRDGSGNLVPVDIGREELANSTIEAVQQLEDYRQRRLTLEAKEDDGSCGRIVLRTDVIESGRQGGNPYRFESTEEYSLELRDGRWLAVRASTMQK